MAYLPSSLAPSGGTTICSTTADADALSVCTSPVLDDVSMLVTGVDGAVGLDDVSMLVTGVDGAVGLDRATETSIERHHKRVKLRDHKAGCYSCNSQKFNVLLKDIYGLITMTIAYKEILSMDWCSNSQFCVKKIENSEVSPFSVLKQR